MDHNESMTSTNEPPDGLPRYRLITGQDDSKFCERVSDMLDLGYVLSGSAAIAAGSDGNVVAQAVVWPMTPTR